jgi:hypothetical protein
MKLDSIVGTRVNRFIVKEKIRMPKATGGGEILYKCLCDCGKTFYLPSNDLQRHTPRDCGCGIRTPLPKEEPKPSTETPSIEEDLPMTEDVIAPSVPLRWQDVSMPDSKIDFFLDCLKQKLKSSKQVYRGVRYKEFTHRYYAYIRIGEDEMRLGSFKDINDAAIARLKAEIFYRGGVQIRTISKKKDTSREKVNCDHAGIVNRVGDRHYAFVVVKYNGPVGNKEMWLCRCDCGKYFFASSGDIENETVKDCGCGLGKSIRRPYKHHLCPSFSKYEVDGTNLAMLDSNKLNNRNKSGARGVYLDSKTGKWVAKLVFRGIAHREVCTTKKDAISKRVKMEKEYFAPILVEHKKSIKSNHASTKAIRQKCYEMRFKLAEAERN